jgi:hypothetical protein
MSDCKPCSTSVDTQAKVSFDMGVAPISGLTAYRSLARALQYLTFTRPDIFYAVQQVCLHMHDPREPHLTAVKWILRFLQGTFDYILLLCRASPSELVVYTDANWTGCPDTRRSTSGYAVFLGDNLVSWSSKRQTVVSHSSAKAEYRAMANGVAKACWLRQLLQEFHSPCRGPLWSIATTSARSTSPPTLSNISAPNMLRSTSTSFVSVSPLEMCVSSTSRRDIFTKGLPSSVFSEFRSSFNIYRG